MIAERKAALALVAITMLVACSDDAPEEAGAAPTTTAAATSAPESTAEATTTLTTAATEAPGYVAPGDAESAAAAGVTRQQVDDALGMIDGFVEAEMEKTGVPGVAVAVVYDDEVVFAEGYGVREVGTDDAVSADTVFQIASLSKPITGTALAGLVSKGIIDWDEPVHPYAPDLIFSDPWVTDHVTFADLYSHRSGLPGGVGDSLDILGYTRDEILSRLRYVPLNPFRATYAYSNFGMTAGGDAAAKAAGVSFEDMIDEQLFEPAGMDTASARYADFLERPDRATIHVRLDGEWVPGPTRQPDAQAPAGGVSAAVTDVATWVRLQLSGGTLDGEEIVSEEALQPTHTPHIAVGSPGTYDGQTISYGLGWNVLTDHLGYLRWAHSGAFTRGAATNATLLPAAGLGVIVLTNGVPIGVPEALVDEIIDQIVTGGQTQDWQEYWSGSFGGLHVADPALSELPEPPTPARPTDAYLGSYANDFYGMFEVVADGEGMALVEGPDRLTFPLTHWDADTFTYVGAPELPELRAAITFTIGPDGRASSIFIGDSDGEGIGTLNRV
jgi:CubicO group peptidase (beta-lactamase class C family)